METGENEPGIVLAVSERRGSGFSVESGDITTCRGPGPPTVPYRLYWSRGRKAKAGFMAKGGDACFLKDYQQ